MLDYIKSFLALFLLVKVLLYFVPKKAFQKYISFFSGVILVIGMLYPLLQLLGKEELILEKLQYKEWEKQLLEISIEAERMENAGMEILMEQYQEQESVGEERENIVIETVKIGGSVQTGEINE